MATVTKMGYNGQFRVGDTGGISFEIFGTGLSTASRVYFVDAASKELEAKSFAVISDTFIKCEAPGFTTQGLARVFVTVSEDPPPGKGTAKVATNAVPAKRVPNSYARIIVNELQGSGYSNDEDTFEFVHEFMVGPSKFS